MVEVQNREGNGIRVGKLVNRRLKDWVLEEGVMAYQEEAGEAAGTPDRRQNRRLQPIGSISGRRDRNSTTRSVGAGV